MRGEAEAISEEDDDNNDNDDRDEDDKVIPRTTYYVYDNEDIIMEYNHKGKIRARYVHGLGIDEPLAIVLPHFHHHKNVNKERPRVYYYHLDGLGSITALTDSKGKVVQRYKYDSFGNLKHHGHKVKQPYTYTAREYDRETGLYYYRARYYDAKVGRFITKDPFPGFIDLPQTLNHYSYVGNNPIIFVDPYGLLGWKERAFLGFYYAFRIFSPIPGYNPDLGVIKSVPIIGPIVGVLTNPSQLGDPYLGPDGKWYYPDGTPVEAIPPSNLCNQK